MITPNTITSVGQLVVWKGTIQNGTVANTGVAVAFTIPSDFSILSANLEGVGSLDTVTGIWTIGALTANSTLCFELVLKLDAATQGFDFNYPLEAVVSGLDTDGTNNTLTDTVIYKIETCDPMGASNDSSSGCLCVDVSQYGTPCNEGVTEYRLNLQSIVNGINVSWDVLTGVGDFTAIDPTKEITFTYDQYCVEAGQEFQVSCDTQHIITPQLSDVDVFDHTIETIAATDLTTAQVLALEALYPDETILDYSWTVLYNSDGDITSAVKKDITKELSGYLCDATGNTVLLWNIDGELVLRLTDGTTFMGDVTTLGDCCCTENEVTCADVFTYEPQRVVEEWDGTTTTWASPTPDGEIQLDSVAFIANGAHQFFGLDRYGYTISGGGANTAIAITPTEVWGELDDKCKILITYTVKKNICV